MRNQGGMVLAAALAAIAGPARSDEALSAGLRGFEEVPVNSTTGSGLFIASIGEDAQGPKIDYQLAYRDIEGGLVLQAHIHFGQPSVNGGIAVFLCTNLGNGPAGTQICPQPAPGKPANIGGTIRPTDVVGPANQGISPGEFAELVKAIRGRVTYVNIHSTKWPAGEIRGRVHDSRHEGHED